MSDEERVNVLLENVSAGGPWARTCILELIAVVRAEEREACARIADDGRTVVEGVSQDADTMARMIAAAIRGRE